MNFLRRKIRRSAIACLSLTLCASLTASCATMEYNPSKNPVNGDSVDNSVAFTEVTDQFDTRDLMVENFNSSVLKNDRPVYETRTVIVNLSGECLLDAKPDGMEVTEFLNTSAGQKVLRNIDREQKTFLNKLSSRKIKYELKASYTAVTNAVAVDIDTSYVKSIKDLGGVVSASIAQTYLAPETVEGGSDGSAVSNDAYVYPTGIYNSEAVKDKSWGTGAGMVVAVIDTGLDYSHEAFQTIPSTYRMTKDDIIEGVANTVAFERMAENGETMTADDVYISEKVPFAFDYADTDVDVYPSYSNHGTHVAGIVAGQADSYVDKDGNVAKDENGNVMPFRGVAPDAQLVICKTFTDNLDSVSLGGAEAESIMAALDDCVKLGVDVINMSLGTTAGFTTTDDGDDEGEIFDGIFKRIQKAGISLICAASNDYSAGFGSIYGTNLASNPDSGTVGSPSTYFAALSVASISGQKTQYLLTDSGEPIFFDNSSNGSGTDYDFVGELLGDEASAEGKKYKYVVAGSGQKNDYRGDVADFIKDNEDVIVLVRRGVNTFQEKVEIAKDRGAAGIIVWNNVSGTIRMSLGDLDSQTRIPSASINNDAGRKLVEIAEKSEDGISGEIIVSTRAAGPFMSEFSSWGSTNDLKIKPEITAHGGEITSTVPGGYAKQSGTSMAAPNMAGLTAIIRNYINSELGSVVNVSDSPSVTQLANQLMMSTASIARDQNNLPYSPRKQGAGLANLGNIVSTNAYLLTDESTSNWYTGKDYRPKVELGEDENKTGVYKFDFKVRNFGNTPLNFKLKTQFMTETLGNDGIAVKEQAYMLKDVAPEYTFKGSVSDGNITVLAGETATIGVTLKLSAAEKKYIDDSFINGMFVEGFVELVSADNTQCDLSLPFMGFYGDWEQAPMLDYTAYEIAQFQQDGSYTDETRPKETIWATQPFASYNEENYVIPLGSFLYTTDPNETPMYASMEHIAVSRFNEIVSEEGIGNYATTYNIRCVYAGLLRNAQRVKYNLYDAYTGELILDGEKNRISKAYASGGSARPAYVELMFSPEELGLMSNGKYTLELEFLFHKDDVLTEEQKEDSTFAFDFYVDYEAPVLRDARLRYEDYKENNKEKQHIYLDLDIFDNHYAQSVMLCYIDTEGDVQELKLATDYVTPVRDAVKNGVSTVSIDVTDIWEEHKNGLAVQLDDYALNHSSYILGNLNTSDSIEGSLSKNVLPDTFELADGEENITLDINEMHKVSLEYEGDANLSNFGWSTAGMRYIAVKNGEIVGLASTNGRSYPVTVTNYKGVTKRINVTVTDKTTQIRGVSFGFGTIKNSNEAIVKAENSVSVYAGEEFDLNVVPTPWYYPESMITSIEWSSNLPDIASVDENGHVHTYKHGSATISAVITAGGSSYRANVEFAVKDEFTMNGLTLTRYRGEGETYTNPNTGEIEENVVIVPKEIAVITIGENAFKDNKKIKKIIIPQTVTQIEKDAFKGCTALEEVYFMTDKLPEEDYVPDSDLTLINRSAFEGCTSLKLLDLTYTKVFTVGREAFKDCTSLAEIRKSSSIGTAHHRAFMGCTSLTEFDASGMHSAGTNVFSGCTSLSKVTFDKFTHIGDYMFAGLDYYYEEYDYTTGEWNIKNTLYPSCDKIKEVVLKSPTVGEGAFAGCLGLETVTFSGHKEVRIGEGAFAGCAGLKNVSYENGSTIKIIGARAFAGCTALTEFTLPAGLEIIGEGAFSNTGFNPAVNDQTTVTPDGEVLSSDGKTLLLYIGKATEYTLPASIERIGAYAFAGSKVEKITVSASVKEIGEGAFMNSALNSIEILASISEIAPYAFAGTALTSITLPSSVNYIGDNAFSNVTGLTEFNYAPAGEAAFGSYVFSGCNSLTEISLNSKITEMGDMTFWNCTKLESVNMPAVKSLGSLTFFNTPALKEVIFDAGATVTGDRTFAAYGIEGFDYPEQRPVLTNVKLGTSLEKIGEGVFENCTGITSVNLGGASAVGNRAFYGATALTAVTGLEGLKNIGEYAFANTKLTSLNLVNAEIIGDGAFMMERSGSYNSISLNKAVSIGELAFYGNRTKEITLPASLTTVGAGAFAGAPALTQIKVEEGNEVFFSRDGVLYRNIDSTGSYGLVAFPSAKSVTEYSVIDNTARIEARAFEGYKGKLGKIILPYSLKSIGVKAFFNSGITVYEFKGVSAPALEAEYSEEVNDYVNANNINYRGYYYANFQDYFIYYSELGIGTSVLPLTALYPENGKGYDNHVYSAYFSKISKTEIAMEEATYNFVQAVSSFPEASEISKWNKDNKTEREVRQFSDTVKRTHEYLAAFSNDPVQLALVEESLISKFNDIETALRTVKPIFNITVRVLRLEASGNYKSTYFVGEKFDMNGLVITVVYDDYSTELADMSKAKLVSPTGELSKLDTIVTVSYENRDLRIRITVTDKDVVEPDDPENGCSGCGGTSTGIAVISAFAMIAGVLAVTTIARKKFRGRK